MKKLISILSPCYNEEGNIEILYGKVKDIFAQLPQYSYEHIFIDNASTDKTVEILKCLATQDKNLKIIVNTRNFGVARSHFHGMRETYGDAVISLCADLQDPPELIPQLLKKWEDGYKIVCAIRSKREENFMLFSLRKLFYRILAKFSETEQIQNFFGFGLYDKAFMDIIRSYEDSYPYFRGFITETGLNRTELTYTQTKRSSGKSKHNFYILYDIAISGFVNHSKLLLRLASFIGFGVALLSLLISLVYLVLKLIWWHTFIAGTAPMVIGLFFFSSVQLFFIGIIGEYVGAIHTQVRKRPLVVEKERINFSKENAKS
ncbi:MAG: glycosyltransferase family 2 protein [Prevotellaceae bacterium]|jgi:glycosyltransferase involved in cell wall biosynthesis|nr:glycosyltransferase family 2 protein [Prevotellaceae bacterium]